MWSKFPDPNLDFGGPRQVSYEGNKILIKKALGTSTPSGDEIENWASFTALVPYRCRKLKRANGLYQSETHLETIDCPKAFWIGVMEIAPPRNWVNKLGVMKYLSETRPMAPPFTTRIWVEAKDWLDDVLKKGSNGGWADDMTIDAPETTAEFWEAIRIIGDSRRGFGTFPKLLEDKMTDTGLHWIRIDPRKRIIPKCWVSWARKYGFSYKSTVSVVPTGQQQQQMGAASPNVGSSSQSHHHSIPKLDSELSRETKPSVVTRVEAQATEQVKPATSPTVGSSSQFHHQEVPKSDTELPGDTKPPVVTCVEAQVTEQVKPAAPAGTHGEANPILPEEQKAPVCSTRAWKALEALRSSTVPPADQRLTAVSIRQPREEFSHASKLWRDVEANLKTLSTNQVHMHNKIVRSTQEFVTRTLRDAILGGPVEGLINEIVADASERAHQVMLRQDARLTQLGDQIAVLQRQLETLERAVADVTAKVQSLTSREDENEDMEIDEPLLSFNPMPWDGAGEAGTEDQN